LYFIAAVTDILSAFLIKHGILLAFAAYFRNRMLRKLDMTNWFYKLARWTLGAVFIYAGSIKLLALKPFAVLIEAYGIVPEGLIIPVAVFLPALEVAAGIGLVFDIEKSLGVITGLLILFLVLMIYGIWMGLDIDCGCFGPEDPEAEAFHGLRLSLYRDLIMLVSVAFIYGWRRYLGIKPIKITRLTKKLWEKRIKKDAYV
jgi:hypothetical protein